jgi:hypothetical protein
VWNGNKHKEPRSDDALELLHHSLTHTHTHTHTHSFTHTLTHSHSLTPVTGLPFTASHCNKS